MKRLQDQRGMIDLVLIIVVLVLAAGLGGYVVYRQHQAQQAYNAAGTGATVASHPKAKTTTTPPATTTKALVKGDFGDNGTDYGTLQAEGYPTTVKTNEAFCESNCKQYSYVFFTIARTENANIFNWLKTQSGNAYAQDKGVGMGCLADGQISYSNSSDSKGMAQYAISKDDTTKIMAATAAKPIVLQLTRLKFTGGSGAPTCYSHFTTFSVVN